MQNADHGAGQVFEGPIENAACAFVAPSRGMKNGFGAGQLASLPERQLRRRGTVKMGKVVRLDGPGRKTRFQAAAVSADTQSAVEVEGHVSEMPCGPGGSAEDRAVDQCGTADACAQGQ